MLYLPQFPFLSHLHLCNTVYKYYLKNTNKTIVISIQALSISIGCRRLMEQWMLIGCYSMSTYQAFTVWYIFGNIHTKTFHSYHFTPFKDSTFPIVRTKEEVPRWWEWLYLCRYCCIPHLACHYWRYGIRNGNLLPENPPLHLKVTGWHTQDNTCTHPF